MPTYNITFRPADVTFEIDPDCYPYGDHGRPGSILDIALTHGVDIPAACGGQVACGTCHVYIVRGMENLSTPDDREQDLIDTCADNRLTSRLACAAVVMGDVVVDVPDH